MNYTDYAKWLWANVMWRILGVGPDPGPWPPKQ